MEVEEINEHEPSPNGGDLAEDPHQEAVDKAANLDPDTDPEQVTRALAPDADLATEWFMSDTPDSLATKTFELNVGRYEDGDWEDFYIPWTVHALGRDRIRLIRRASQPRRRRGGPDVMGVGEDDLKANEMIASEGTTHPDLTEAAKAMGIANPAMVLRSKLKHKPGLIDQIAGEVLSASGYDDQDVREVTAAKNS